jgi:hypothetical protein
VTVESTNSRSAFGAPERGRCTACGQERPLAFGTGMIKRHRVGGEPCPGGARPPAESKAEQPEQTVHTADRL